MRNWFEVVMDSCKECLELSAKNLRIFIPSLVYLGVTVFLIVACIVAVIIFFIGSTMTGSMLSAFGDVASNGLPLMLGLAGLIVLVLLIMYSMVQAGVLAMLRTYLQDGRADYADFFAGLKKNWLGMFLGFVLVFLLLLLLAIPIAILVPIAGILTFGWGFLFGVVVLFVFFATWPVILTVDEEGVLSAIGKGFKIGKKFFWPLMVIGLLWTVIPSYLSGLVIAIPLVGLLAVPVVGTLLGVYFRFVLMRFYLSTKEEYSPKAIQYL